MEKKTVGLHIEQRTIHTAVIDPDHGDRTESPEFTAAKHRLKEDGHYKCYVCGTDKNIQIHHRISEYMFNNITDYAKLKEKVEEWDVYGYGRLLRNKPITSVDDIRNMLALCQGHHTGVDHENNKTGTGIHDVDMSTFWIMVVALDGANPVPQPGETADQAAARVKAHERKEG